MKHLRCPPCGTVRVQGSRLCTRYQRRRSTRCGTCGAHRCGTVGVRGSRLRTRSSAHGGQAVSYAHRGPRQEWALGCVARLRACVACGHAGRYSARDSGAPRVLSVLSEVIRRTHGRALVVGGVATCQGATCGAFVLMRRCQTLVLRPALACPNGRTLVPLRGDIGCSRACV